MFLLIFPDLDMVEVVAQRFLKYRRKRTRVKEFDWKVFALTTVTALAGIAAVIAYLMVFRHRPLGGPEEWGQLGDYLGGVINPVVGIVTVVLVVMTLRVTRAEAQAARAQIAEQLKYMERQAVLSDMHKRLEGVLVEWERIMARRAPEAFQEVSSPPRLGGRTVVSDHTVREVLEDFLLRDRLLRTWIDDDKKSGDRRFGLFKADVVQLVYELDDYCRQYDETAGTKHLTFFYRSRLRRAVEMLSLGGVMQDSVADRFKSLRPD